LNAETPTIKAMHIVVVVVKIFLLLLFVVFLVAFF
jgi:hypothetical protein